MSLPSPDIADKLRAFEQACRQSGFPVTVQRRVILECVLRRDDHPTADQVHEQVRVRVPEISRTTVYRTLEALVHMGAIRRAHHLGSAARFDGNTRHHHHLVCIRCNAISDFEGAGLDGLPIPDEGQTGFHITDYSVHYAGVCKSCRGHSREAGPA
jgi:Fe2+ or Zn2+ uptake regulation protein